MNNVSGQPGMVKTGVDSLDLVGNANHNDIKSRIQLLESELSSVLHSLRTNTNEVRMLTVRTNTNEVTMLTVSHKCNNTIS